MASDRVYLISRGTMRYAALPLRSATHTGIAWSATYAGTTTACRGTGRHRRPSVLGPTARRAGAHRAVGTGRARPYTRRPGRHHAPTRLAHLIPLRLRHLRRLVPSGLAATAITMFGAAAVISGWFAASGAVALAAMVR